MLVWSGLAYGHAQALLNRQVDIIVTTDALEDVDGLARRAILNEPFVLVAPTARADEFARMDSAAGAAAPFIRFSRRSHFGAMIERHMRRANVTAPPFLEIDTSDVVMAMIAANLGWALTTPLCLLQGRSWLDQVAVLPLPGPGLAHAAPGVAPGRVRGDGGRVLAVQPNRAGNGDLSADQRAAAVAGTADAPVLKGWAHI